MDKQGKVTGHWLT